MSDHGAAGLYVHVPFCRTKCPYCDFYSTTDCSLGEAWLNAFQREVDLYRGEFSGFDTIYLGGGTPTALHDSQLTTLMECLRRKLCFCADTEITIEANPDDISADGLVHLFDLGFTRISLGIQSMDEDDLRFLGRRHDARRTIRALELVRSSAFTKLNVDLMYGLEGQNAHSWLKTLHGVLEYAPEHLSCYQMTIAKNTPFGRLKAQGSLKPCDEEQGAELFLLTSSVLEDRGYVHYGVSNFAVDAHHISRHNSKYWHRAPYLGLGPGAHSFHQGFRWWNVRSVEDYCSQLSAGNRPVEGSERLSPEQVGLEALLLGFRTRDGIDLELILDDPAAARTVEDLERAGVVRILGQRLVPTRKGFLVADSLPLLFSR